MKNRVSKIIAECSKEYKGISPTYFNTNLKIDGLITVPKQREIYHNNFLFSELSLTEQKKFWLDLWNDSDDFLVMNQAIYFLENNFKTPKGSDWGYLKKFVYKIDNWSHADRIASFYAKAFEADRYAKSSKIKNDLISWNNSKNPWQRRQSLISIFYYSAHRKAPYPTFTFCRGQLENLIVDEHFYVQKAVGWFFREMYNVYPEKTRQLLIKHAANIPPAGWQAASEKLSQKEKLKLKQDRKLT